MTAGWNDEGDSSDRPSSRRSSTSGPEVKDGFEPDPERVEFLREIADEIRGDSSEREQLANVLYRTSDLYDDAEDTSPEEIVRNVKFILEVNERGGLER